MLDSEVISHLAVHRAGRPKTNGAIRPHTLLFVDSAGEPWMAAIGDPERCKAEAPDIWKRFRPDPIGAIQ